MFKVAGRLSALAALALPLCLTACVASGEVVAQPPPPPLAEAVTVAPYPGAVWVAGHHRWTGGGYVWVAGHWERPRAGAVWMPAHWARRGHGWVFVPGRWRRI